MSDGARPILMNASLRARQDGVIAEVVLSIDGHEVRKAHARPLDEGPRAAAEAAAKALAIGCGVDLSVLEVGEVNLGGFQMASVVVESPAIHRQLAGLVVIAGDDDVARAFAKAVLDAVNRFVTNDKLLTQLRRRSAPVDRV